MYKVQQLVFITQDKNQSEDVNILGMSMGRGSRPPWILKFDIFLLNI